MIVQGKICICDVCGKDDPHGRWIYEEGKPLRERCKNKKCRSRKWNSGDKDKRTWPRIDPNPFQRSPKN